jgi:hypothetical protein
LATGSSLLLPLLTRGLNTVNGFFSSSFNSGVSFVFLLEGFSCLCRDLDAGLRLRLLLLVFLLLLEDCFDELDSFGVAASTTGDTGIDCLELDWVSSVAVVVDVAVALA